MNARKQQVLQILSLRKQKQNFFWRTKCLLQISNLATFIIVSLIVIFHLQVFNLILNYTKKN